MANQLDGHILVCSSKSIVLIIIKWILCISRSWFFLNLIDNSISRRVSEILITSKMLTFYLSLDYMECENPYAHVVLMIVEFVPWQKVWLRFQIFVIFCTSLIIFFYSRGSLKSLFNCWFFIIHGLPVIVHRILFWHLCNFSIKKPDAVPHNCCTVALIGL